MIKDQLRWEPYERHLYKAYLRAVLLDVHFLGILAFRHEPTTIGALFGVNFGHRADDPRVLFPALLTLSQHSTPTAMIGVFPSHSQSHRADIHVPLTINHQPTAMRALGKKCHSETVMSKYHKMDTNKYLNIFGCHIMYQANIRIYSDATYLPNKYPNIFVRRK